MSDRGSLMALLVVAVLGGCRPRAQSAVEAKRQVRCASAEPMRVVDTIELRGTISPLPDRDALVSAQVAGRIVQVLVREGDLVKAGQLLARLDDAPLVDELHAAQAALAQTDAEVKNAEATAARVQRVFAHGIAARQEVDDALTRAQAAQAVRDEAEATVRRARRQVQRASVPSPMAGTVVRLLRKSGELVDGTPTTPIVEVADPNHLELVADATAADLVRLRRGQPAELTIAALPDVRWKGTVITVSPAVDRVTGLGTVRIALEGPVHPPIGLLGTARLQTGAPRTSVGVPSRAVRTGAGSELEIALCGADGRAHVRRIERGASAGGLTEAPGLQVGQRVVVEPVLGIADGDAIELEK